MDIFSMTGLDILSSHTGSALSMEHKCMLENSIAQLQEDDKAKEIRFLGRIIGLDGDYFLLQTVGDDVLADVKFFYSNDATNWSLLQSCDPALIAAARKVMGYFTGDPGYNYDESPGEGDDEEPEDRKAKVLLKEEDRLAYVVHRLFHETAVVPRKALLYTPRGQVITNPSFRGLSQVQADERQSYLHLRVPRQEHFSNRSTADADLAIDFLEPLGSGSCSAAWALTMCDASGVVILRNITWPGFVFYHKYDTAEYGYYYMGTGQENLDMPFMLPSIKPETPVFPAAAIQQDEAAEGSVGRASSGSNEAAREEEGDIEQDFRAEEEERVAEEVAADEVNGNPPRAASEHEEALAEN